MKLHRISREQLLIAGINVFNTRFKCNQGETLVRKLTNAFIICDFKKEKKKKKKSFGLEFPERLCANRMLQVGSSTWEFFKSLNSVLTGAAWS